MKLQAYLRGRGFESSRRLKCYYLVQTENRHFRPNFHQFCSIFWESFFHRPKHMCTKNHAFTQMPWPQTNFTIMCLRFGHGLTLHAHFFQICGFSDCTSSGMSNCVCCSKITYFGQLVRRKSKKADLPMWLTIDIRKLEMLFWAHFGIFFPNSKKTFIRTGKRISSEKITQIGRMVTARDGGWFLVSHFDEASFHTPIW